jgi:hypothetical protein
MAIWLLIAGLVLLIVYLTSRGGLRVEGFGFEEQKAFGDQQNTYFFDQADKAILTNPGLNLAALNAAVAQPDMDMPVNKFKDMTKFFMEDPENAWTAKDNEFCKGARHPRNLPARGAKDVVGCGWYFFEDPERASMGAIGTARGPALPHLLPTGGTWMWNRAEAMRAEDVKFCKTLKSCEFVELGDMRGACGFCPEKGHGVPVMSNGTVKYPDAGCGTAPLTRASACRGPARPKITAANGRACGKGGRPSEDGKSRLYTPDECRRLGGTHIEGDLCIRPQDGGSFSAECAGLNVPVASKAGCRLDKPLDQTCLLELATKNGFASNGGLVGLIKTRKASAMAAEALRTLAESGMPIANNTWNGQPVSANDANTAFQSIRTRLGTEGDYGGAVKFLVDGTNFNPCGGIKGEQTGPFKPECLQRAFRKAGCQASGSAHPSARVAVSETANMTWSQVNGMFKKLYDDMKSPDARTQDMALKNCLGPGAEYHRVRKDTCWKCQAWPGAAAFTPVRRNAMGDIECASTNGRDCLYFSQTKADCERRLGSVPTETRPLTCGPNHKAQWGVTGYDVPSHWCAAAQKNVEHKND